MTEDRLIMIAQNLAKPNRVRSHTAGTIKFEKDTGPIRRDIRVKDFDWSPDSLRNLAKILWAAQRAHSYAMSAYRLFSKMPSADFSPDGMLGGRGYIQNVKDMRSALASAVEAISAFTDTVHDEVNAEHWSTAEEAAPAVQPMVEDAEAVKANPDSFIESEFGQVGPGEFAATDDEESSTIENPDADEMNPQIENDEENESEEEEEYSGFAQASSEFPKSIKPKKLAEAKLPTDETDQKQGKTEVEMTMHTTTPDHGSYASSIARILKSHERRVASTKYFISGGSSAIPQGDLGGPRVEHVGPGETEEGFASDDPSGEWLQSGVNTSVPIYEDWCADGVSGYEDPTSGDSSVLGIASKLAAGYSWLPGSANEKLMPYYDRSVTPQDDQWMRENNKPDMPAGIGPQKPPRSRRDEYWEALHTE